MTKKIKLARQKGFSLIEMILYMGILGAFLVVMSQVFIASLNTQVESETASAIQQDGRFILSRLAYDVARAQSVSLPAALGGQDTSLQIIIDGNDYTYATSNGNLQLTDDTGTDPLNSVNTTVSDLTFNRIGNVGGKDTVQITFTLTAGGGQNNQEVKSFQTALSLR